MNWEMTGLFRKSFLPESLKTLEVHIARTCNISEKTLLKFWQFLTTSQGPAHREGEHPGWAASPRSAKITQSPVGHGKRCAKGLVLLWSSRALPSGMAGDQEEQRQHPEFPFPLTFASLHHLTDCSTCELPGWVMADAWKELKLPQLFQHIWNMQIRSSFISCSLLQGLFRLIFSNTHMPIRHMVVNFCKEVSLTSCCPTALVCARTQSQGPAITR